MSAANFTLKQYFLCIVITFQAVLRIAAYSINNSLVIRSFVQLPNEYNGCNDHCELLWPAVLGESRVRAAPWHISTAVPSLAPFPLKVTDRTTATTLYHSVKFEVDQQPEKAQV